jgi:glycosyltransferase involved in cell wall biosynthesis
MKTSMQVASGLTERVWTVSPEPEPEPEQNPVLSILIISKTPENMNRLLAWLVDGGVSESFEVLCAWNGGTGSIEEIQVGEGLVFHLFELTPYHFARNNNFLAKRARGTYLLFMNDDVIPDPGGIDRALMRIRDESVGIVGVNLRYPNGTVQHAGVFFEADGKTFHRFKHELQWDHPQLQVDEFVPAVTGAFLLMRREEFVVLQFDEEFLVAGQDIGLNLRYREKFDREILYVGSATAVHAENVTRRKTGERLTPQEDVRLIKSYASIVRDGRPLTEVRRPRIRIVTEAPGWILNRMAQEIQRHIGTVKVNEDWPEADVHYYLNYGYMRVRPSSGLVVANFTHYDPDHLADDFLRVAHAVDHCVAISRSTAEELKRLGVLEEKITVILIGADAAFEPKLTVGLTGRVYPGGRKGEDIVGALLGDSDITSQIRIVATTEEWGAPVWSFVDRADFYRAIDYLLITSRLEGGPVPFMEALACGTLSVAPPVGVAPDFPHVSYPVGDVARLKTVLLELAANHRRQRGWFAAHMKGLDWQHWGVEHEKLFRRLIMKRQVTSMITCAATRVARECSRPSVKI